MPPPETGGQELWHSESVVQAPQAPPPLLLVPPLLLAVPLEDPLLLPPLEDPVPLLLPELEL